MKPPLTDELRISLLEFLYLLSRTKRLYQTNVKYAAQLDADELMALIEDASMSTRELLDEDSSSRGTRYGLSLYPGILGRDEHDAGEIRARRALSMRRTSGSGSSRRPPAGTHLH